MTIQELEEQLRQEVNDVFLEVTGKEIKWANDYTKHIVSKARNKLDSLIGGCIDGLRVVLGGRPIESFPDEIIQNYAKEHNWADYIRRDLPQSMAQHIQLWAISKLWGLLPNSASAEAQKTIAALHKQLDATRQRPTAMAKAKVDKLIGELAEQLGKVNVECLTGLTSEAGISLEELILKLNWHQRLQLTSGQIVFNGVGAWLDFGQVFQNTWLELDDRHKTADGKPRPLVHIAQRIEWTISVQTIDVLASIEANPGAIWNPAIAFAIRHWQHLVEEQSYWEQSDIYDTLHDRKSKSAQEQAERAQGHLKLVGQAIRTFKKRTKPVVLKAKIEKRGITLKDRTNPLYVAWELLDWKKDIHPETEYESSCKGNDAADISKKIIENRVAQIAEVLYQKPRSERLEKNRFKCASELTSEELEEVNKFFAVCQHIRIEQCSETRLEAKQVLSFLATEGSKYVYDYDKSADGQESFRRNWEEVSNAFIKWFYNEEYLHENKKRAKTERPFIREPYHPFWGHTKENSKRIANSVYESLTEPLVTLGRVANFSTHEHKLNIANTLRELGLDSEWDKL